MKKLIDKPGPDGIFIADANCYIDGHGQRIWNVHASSQCAARGACAIHNPSEHHMRAWPTLIRIPGPWDIKPMHMERTCPHGIGHPDPDDMTYWVSRGEYSMGVHGCDDCCHA